MRFESGDSFEQLRSFAGQASAIGAQLCKNMFVFVFVFVFLCICICICICFKLCLRCKEDSSVEYIAGGTNDAS